MTLGADAQPTPTATDAPWRSIGIFVILTACLSGIFGAFINLTQASPLC